MTAAKFAFSRAFPETTAKFVPLEEKEPTLTLSEHGKLLALAVADARTQGYLEGQDQARHEETARLARAMESVGMAFDGVRQELTGIERAATDEALRFAHDLARVLAGRLMDRAPLETVASIARDIFEDLRGQPHVAVRVAPELTDAANELMRGLARERGFEGRLIVMGEPEIAPGDVRIEWADGGVVRDRARVEELVAASVDKALAAGFARGV
ncbi:MAG: FliH/SctL family protein [Beijerinckiaceae bacterium]